MLLDGKYRDVSKIDWSERTSNQRIFRVMFGRYECCFASIILFAFGVTQHDYKLLLASVGLAVMALHLHRTYKQLINPSDTTDHA